MYYTYIIHMYVFYFYYKFFFIYKFLNSAYKIKVLYWIKT